MKPFTRLEVEAALQQMGPLKSPRSDGFRVSFYQKYWIAVGTDVCNVALSLLNGKGMVSSLNSTFIALIQKKNNVLILLLIIGLLVFITSFISLFLRLLLVGSSLS